MGEAVAAVASIVQLVGFGLSTAEKLYQFAEKVSSHSQQVRRLAGHVRRNIRALEKLEHSLSEDEKRGAGINDDFKEDIISTVESCRDILVRLEDAVGSHSGELDEQPPRKRRSLRVGLKKAKYALCDDERIERFRNELSQCETTLQLMLVIHWRPKASHRAGVSDILASELSALKLSHVPAIAEAVNDFLTGVAGVKAREEGSCNDGQNCSPTDAQSPHSLHDSAQSARNMPQSSSSSTFLNLFSGGATSSSSSAAFPKATGLQQNPRSATWNPSSSASSSTAVSSCKLERTMWIGCRERTPTSLWAFNKVPITSRDIDEFVLKKAANLLDTLASLDADTSSAVRKHVEVLQEKLLAIHVRRKHSFGVKIKSRVASMDFVTEKDITQKLSEVSNLNPFESNLSDSQWLGHMLKPSDRLSEPSDSPVRSVPPSPSRSKERYAGSWGKLYYSPPQALNSSLNYGHYDTPFTTQTLSSGAESQHQPSLMQQEKDKTHSSRPTYPGQMKGLGNPQTTNPQNLTASSVSTLQAHYSSYTSMPPATASYGWQQPQSSARRDLSPAQTLYPYDSSLNTLTPGSSLGTFLAPSMAGIGSQSMSAEPIYSTQAASGDVGYTPPEAFATRNPYNLAVLEHSSPPELLLPRAEEAPLLQATTLPTISYAPAALGQSSSTPAKILENPSRLDDLHFGKRSTIPPIEALISPAAEDSKRPRAQCWDHGCNGREFSTFSNLLRHQRERSGTPLRPYCPRCGAEFKRSTQRTDHLLNSGCKPRSYKSGVPIPASYPTPSGLTGAPRHFTPFTASRGTGSRNAQASAETSNSRSSSSRNEGSETLRKRGKINAMPLETERPGTAISNPTQNHVADAIRSTPRQTLNMPDDDDDEVQAETDTNTGPDRAPGIERPADIQPGFVQHRAHQPPALSSPQHGRQGRKRSSQTRGNEPLDVREVDELDLPPHKVVWEDEMEPSQSEDRERPTAPETVHKDKVEFETVTESANKNSEGPPILQIPLANSLSAQDTSSLGARSQGVIANEDLERLATTLAESLASRWNS